MFTLRFDMRAPERGAPATDLYAAAIDMCSWAETRGAVIVVLSEHHATEDGHLPVPHILASAIAARTKHLAILLAAVPITFWDPVRLAEEISVLDIISKGRVSYAFGIGHRTEEYEHFGVDLHERGKLADESLALLLRLLTGEPVDHAGRRIHVTPAPTTAGGPCMLVAGGSKAAARRAAKFGLGFISQTDSPELKEFYESACRAHGREPGVDPVSRSETRRRLSSSPMMWTRRGMSWARTFFMMLLPRRRTAMATTRVASISRADDRGRASRGQRPVPGLQIDEAAAYIRSGQTASAASALRWCPARAGVALSRTRRDSGRARMTRRQ